jgi:hypothetical protein
MAVEWLRDCYSSEWHLFRDDAAIKTPGTYYWSGESVPFYAGNHNLGSRVWHDGNHPVVITLGEDLESQRPWDDGDDPVFEVLTRALGSPACLDAGELVANALDGADLIGNFPPGCIIPADELETLWREVSDFERCQVQRMYASLLVFLYGNDDDAITRLIEDWLGLAPTIRIRHHHGPYNGLITITTSRWQVAILDGTSTFQEFALQAFAFVTGTTNVGSYSTARLWYESASNMLGYMQEDGLTADKRLMVVGHSYGACVAYNIAARIRLAGADREIKYLCFGPPKIGDDRFVEIIQTCQGQAVINDDDIVTVLPPDRASLAALIPLFATPALLLYTQWQRSRPQIELLRNGSMRYNVFPLLDFETLFNLISRVLLQEVIDPISPHFMTEYLCRLQVRCPEAAWPIDDQVNFDATCGCQSLALVEIETKPPRGLILRHPTSILPPEPGFSCITAGDMPRATWINRSSVGITDDWWTFVCPAGSNVKIKFNAPGPNLTAGVVLYNTCPSLITYDFINNTQNCVTFLGSPFDPLTIFVKVFNVVLVTPYSLFWDLGNCP